MSSRRISPDLKIFAELYACQQSAAVRGVIPLHIFRSATKPHELSEVEPIRLTDELTRLKLRVGQPVHSTEPDSRARGEFVLPRMVMRAGFWSASPTKREGAPAGPWRGWPG